MTRKFAISDIHGCAQTLKSLLSQLAFSKSDSLYLLGDYIDRGPDSKGVLDQIFQMKKDGYEVHCLMGNHEEMFQNAFRDTFDLRLWRDNGGMETLASFGAKLIRDIPVEYNHFIDELKYYIEVDGYILVHAGLDFRTGKDPLANKKALTWARNWHSDIDFDWLGDRVIIHGHTPVTESEIRTQVRNLPKNQFLDIDSGCAYYKSSSRGLGRLCAFDLTNRIPFFHPYIDYAE